VHAHKELLIFCLKNQNEKFLRHALNTSIFGPTDLKENSVIEQLLEMLTYRSKTELILNVLIYNDFSGWP
jgi:hypothetical protein